MLCEHLDICLRYQATVFEYGSIPHYHTSLFLPRDATPCQSFRQKTNESHDRSNLDPIAPGPCRPLVLLCNALCLVGGLLVRVACTAADQVELSEADGGGRSAAAEAAEATAAAAAALAFLAAGLVVLALSVCCPELPNPLGGAEVGKGIFFLQAVASWSCC